MDIKTTTSIQAKIKFTHFVDVKSSKCSIGTAREEGTRKIKLYLLSEDSTVYERNGLKQSWVDMGESQYSGLCEFVREALKDESIPHFETHNLNIN